MIRLMFLVASFALIGCTQSDNPHPPNQSSRNTQSSTDMLTTDVINEINSFVRSGFYDREQLIEMFCGELYAPGELDAAVVESTVDASFTAYEKEKGSFPSVTDCDRLDSAFAALNSRGVIAIQNAGYTQSDGYDDVSQAFSEHSNPDSVLGYCFYHGQDLQRTIDGGGLFFAFGPVDPAEEQTKGVEVGNVVREELERAGLVVDWNGEFDKRLSVPQITWQKR